MKKKLKLKKYKKKICFDLDGVICKTKKNFYEKSKPIKSSIDKINQLYDQGNFILIYTARFMGRTKENSSEAKKKGYLLTINQLKNWGLKFNKLMMGKPSYDLIIDDKAINYSSNWKKKL